MAIRRLKFIWSPATGKVAGPWRLGVWSRHERDPGSRIEVLAVSVRGVLLWGAALAVAAYMAGAVALHAWWQRNPYNQVTLTDAFLLPVRWQRVQLLRGRAMIEEGLAALRARRWNEAHMLLRAGLGRDPHDQRARLALAQFYTLAGRRPQALQVLNEDLANGYPGRTYLEKLFALANDGEDHGIVIAACDRFLPTQKADRSWLLKSKLAALIAADRPAEALEIARAEGDTAALIREMHTMALLELGRSGEAVAYLEDWRRRVPDDRDQIARLQVRAYRDAGRLAEMGAALEEFRARAPADPRTYIYGVVQRALAGQRAEAEAALDEFFMRFAGRAQNLELMANALAEAKAVALVQRCADEAALHGFPAKSYRFALVQAQMQTGDWAGATRTLAALKPLVRNAGPQEQFLAAWIERELAVAARPDEAPVAGLMEFLQSRPMPLRVMRQTSELLVRAERYEAARSVLDVALRTYPGSAALATLKQKVDKALAPPEKATVVAVAPERAAGSTQQAFFQQLAELEAGERWEAAAQAIRELRVAKPGWLPKRETEVMEAQMRVAVHTDDKLELQAAARMFLDDSGERAVRALALARESWDSGAKEAGEVLLAEVLRKKPGFGPAMRLQREWHPPPPPPGSKAEKKP